MTIIDRAAKLTLIKRVSSKRADVVTEASISLLKTYLDKVLTSSVDNGKEFSDHPMTGLLFRSTTIQIIQNGYHTFQGAILLPLLHKSIKNLAGYGIPILDSNFLISNEEDNLLIKFHGLPVFL